MGIERREHERKNLRGLARLTIVGRSPFLVDTMDISIGGMSAISDVNLPSGQIVMLEFNILVRKINKLTAMKVTAAVAYSAYGEGGFKLGLQFMPLSEQQKLLVLQYVGKRVAPPVPVAAAANTAMSEEEQALDEILSGAAEGG